MVTGQFVRKLGAAATAALALVPSSLFAQEIGKGHPEPGQFHLQQSVTPIMDSIVAFHDGPLMWTITIIVLFVLALLIAVAVRFNAKANPVPARFTHNTLIEVIWTVVPIIVLIVIAIPSFGVLSDQMTTPDGERKYLGANIFTFGEVEVPAASLTIKATGQQWYWDYEYVDYSNFVPDAPADQPLGFTQNIMQEEDVPGVNGGAPTPGRKSAKPNQPRLLAVDNELVVPVNTTVSMQITADAAGVIHAFAVPSFGIKVDAVPGRLNETWFNARETGLYYGQCSELCGKDHAFMPIAVRVVTADEFQTFISAYAEGRDYAAAAALLPAIQ